jgi:hypothetical protein
MFSTLPESSSTVSESVIVAMSEFPGRGCFERLDFHADDYSTFHGTGHAPDGISKPPALRFL